MSFSRRRRKVYKKKYNIFIPENIFFSFTHVLFAPLPSFRRDRGGQEKAGWQITSVSTGNATSNRPPPSSSSVQMNAQALVTPELFLLPNGGANGKLKGGFVANTGSFVSEIILRAYTP